MMMRSSWHACSGAALVALAFGCGADSVNVGDRPEPVRGVGNGSPDAGGSLVEGSSRCNIPNLGQYRLLFDSDGGRLERRIYSMRADGTELEALTPPEELAREPALSPDGRQLAYVTPEGIVLRDMASGQSEPLASDGDQPEWSPDGITIFYRIAFAGIQRCIMQMPLNDRTLDDSNPVACGNFTMAFDLTPDGAQIVFVDASTGNGVENPGSMQVAEISNPGAVSPVVPIGSTSIEQPTVSSDGIWVAAPYQCTDTEPFSLWASPLRVSTRACEGRRITPAGIPSATNPEWGPGVLIAYERGEPPRDIAIIAADTGEECVIEGPGDDRNPSWAVLPPTVPE